MPEVRYTACYREDRKDPPPDRCLADGACESLTRQMALLKALDVEEKWDSTAVARRVQHFGYGSCMVSSLLLVLGL